MFAGCLIEGNIVDQYGIGVPGVTVTLTGEASMSTTTDNNGKFRFGSLENQLSAGSYTVTPSKPGYSFEGKNVSITTTQTQNGPVTIPVNGVDFDIENNGTAYILAVDGMSFKNSIPALPDFEKTSNYLKSALEEMNEENVFGIDNSNIISLIWSRDSEKTDIAVDDLRSILKKLAVAQKDGKKVVVVSHSWGTVLSYLALSYESVVDVPIELDLFITLGSPLGSNLAHEGKLYPLEEIISGYVSTWLQRLDFESCTNCYPRVEKWVNYWVWGDIISGPVHDFDVLAEDIQMGPTGATVLSRNALTTATWHKYDSLQPDGSENNQDLKNLVKSEILKALGI